MNSTDFLKAISSNNVDKLEDYWKDSASWFTQMTAHGKQAIHESVIHGAKEATEYILGKDIEVDALKQGDWTPLMLACAKGNIELINILVLHGARLDLLNKDGWSPFHLACRSGNAAIVEYLYERDNSMIDKRSRNGRTPLHIASFHGRFPVVKILLSKLKTGCDPEDACGTIPVMDALRFEHLDVVDCLLGCKTNLMHEDKSGRNGLHVSAQCNAVSSIVYLVTRQLIDVNLRASISGATALHLAVKEGHLEAVESLLKLYADPLIRDEKGRNALEMAAICNRPECDKAMKMFLHNKMNQ